MTNLKQTEVPGRRIGLFGGTFNPIHKGHLQAAKDVLQQFHLDRIYLIPCALPPHKTHGELAPAKDRVEMIRLALEGQSGLMVSGIEIDRSGPSYTIDTLRAFKETLDEPVELYFLVGVDAFQEIHTWKLYRQLFDLSAFILMSRPAQGAPLPSLPPLAFEFARHHISDGYMLADGGHALVHPEKKTIYPVSVTPIAIASSRIRDMVRNGEPIHQWVTPAVSDYIDSKGLYR